MDGCSRFDSRRMNRPGDLPSPCLAKFVPCPTGSEQNDPGRWRRSGLERGASTTRGELDRELAFPSPSYADHRVANRELFPKETRCVVPAAPGGNQRG